MSESRRCPQCGAELPAGAPDAPCPACLIKLGLESWADRAGDGPGQDAAATETMLGRFQPTRSKRTDRGTFLNWRFSNCWVSAGWGRSTRLVSRDWTGWLP